MQEKDKTHFADRFRNIDIEGSIVRLITAYCIVSAGLLLRQKNVNGIHFQSLLFIENADPILQVSLIALIFLLLSLTAIKIKNPFVYKIILFVSVLFCFSLLCLFGFNEWFFLFLCIFTGVCAYYCFKQPPAIRLPKPARLLPAVLIIVCGIFLLVATETCFRYKALIGDAFDMGLYRQMFYHMTTQGKPLTSLLNNGLSSRFLTDPAPILYALLPLYFASHSMVPFLILQAAALASGVIPLYLICKSRAVTDRYTQIICLVYAFNPGIWAGAFYDFHEQSFFVPFLLWMLYFAEKGKKTGTLIFALLLLMTGKESIILLGAVGLYLIFGLKKRFDGLVILILSGLAFIAAELFLQNYSLLGCDFSDREFFRLLLTDPGYLMQDLLSEGKIAYLVMLFMPLACVPLMNKKYGVWFLYLPVIFIALLNGNGYNSSLYYHHAFGISALLIYSFAVGLPDLPCDFRRICAVFCLAASLMAFNGTVAKRAVYVQTYTDRQDIYEQLLDGVRDIPTDADVAASSNLVALLAERDGIYAYYPETDENGEVPEYFIFDGCDYIVLSLYDENRDANLQTMQNLLDQGNYSEVEIRDQAFAILRSVTYSPM